MNSYKVAWGVGYHKMQGEAGSVDLEAIWPRIEEIAAIIDTYDLDDVYNADETGLFLQTMPDWTLDFDKKAGDAQVTSRVSILLCTNATGTDKRKPYILSMFVRGMPTFSILPCCFCLLIVVLCFSTQGKSLPLGFRTDLELQNLVDVEPWDAEWKTSIVLAKEKKRMERQQKRKAPEKMECAEEQRIEDAQRPTTKYERGDYMTGELFLYWLKQLHASIVAKDPKRKILLLIDNAGCHTTTLKHSSLYESKNPSPSTTFDLRHSTIGCRDHCRLQAPISRLYHKENSCSAAPRA
jgi:hypothetical protein